MFTSMCAYYIKHTYMHACDSSYITSMRTYGNAGHVYALLSCSMTPRQGHNVNWLREEGGGGIAIRQDLQEGAILWNVLWV